MLMNSDSANKLVKQLESARGTLLAQERQVITYSFLQGEEPFKPPYNFTETQEKLGKLNEVIVALKHAINVFNTTTKLPDMDLTVDMALVRLPILTGMVSKLESMAGMLEKTRQTNIAAKAAEYTCRNFDGEEAKRAFLAAQEERKAIQQALNTVNMTETFEVSDSVMEALA